MVTHVPGNPKFLTEQCANHGVMKRFVTKDQYASDHEELRSA